MKQSPTGINTAATQFFKNFIMYGALIDPTNRFGSMRATGSSAISALPFNKRNRGFTLLECLITLVILATGILSLMLLQLESLRSLKHSHDHSQAVLLATEMAKRILINRTGAESGHYNHIDTLAKANKFACNPCNSHQLATWDVQEWTQQLRTASGNSASYFSGSVAGDGKSFAIKVSWPDPATAENGSCPAGTRCFSLRLEI